MLRSSIRLLAVAVASLLAVTVASGCGDTTTNVTTVVKTVAAKPSAPTVTHHSAKAKLEAPPPSPYKQCDANISARRGTTTCAFAENVFYEYWSNGEAEVVRAYSPLTGQTYTTTCAPSAGRVTCTAGDGGRVRFSQAAVAAYSQSQADRYAATHEVGADEAPSSGQSASASCDPAYEGACVPNDGADYDCDEIDGSDFSSVGDDPDGLDADGDGIACES